MAHFSSDNGECTVTCDGYAVVRPECSQNACLGDNMCYRFMVNASNSIDPASVPSCREWCCVSMAGTAFGLVILFSLGLFFALAGAYMWRLHRENVASGAITADGKRAKDKWVEVPITKKIGDAASNAMSSISNAGAEVKGKVAKQVMMSQLK